MHQIWAFGLDKCPSVIFDQLFRQDISLQKLSDKLGRTSSCNYRKKIYDAVVTGDEHIISLTQDVLVWLKECIYVEFNIKSSNVILPALQILFAWAFPALL